MISPNRTSNLVSAEWLSERLNDSSLKILDGTWSVTQSDSNLIEGVIPGALFFDLGFLKSSTPLGAAYPPQNILISMLNQLGVKETDLVVVYDRYGLFSSPRVWWSLKTLGHENVKVLSGGLPAWINKGYAINSKHSTPSGVSDYKAKVTQVYGVTIDDVVSAIDTHTQIVDARPLERFKGTMPEPRKGLRSGHIPSSLSLPLGHLKDKNGQLYDEEKLISLINEVGINWDNPIITTCGSGVTAAALALIFQSLGKNDISVYTGSWTEYGASNHPVKT